MVGKQKQGQLHLVVTKVKLPSIIDNGAQNLQYQVSIQREKKSSGKHNSFTTVSSKPLEKGREIEPEVPLDAVFFFKLFEDNGKPVALLEKDGERFYNHAIETLKNDIRATIGNDLRKCGISVKGKANGFADISLSEGTRD